MSHVRKQIRDALKARLTGLTTTGANVETTRIHSFVEEDAALPGLVIFPDVEEILEPSEDLEIGSQHRILNIIVQGYEQAVSDMEDTLDLIAEEVETAVFTDQFFGGLVHSTDLVGTEIDIMPGASAPLGVVTLSFRLSYMTREGAPGTSI